MLDRRQKPFDPLADLLIWKQPPVVGQVGKRPGMRFHPVLLENGHRIEATDDDGTDHTLVDGDPIERLTGPAHLHDRALQAQLCRQKSFSPSRARTVKPLSGTTDNEAVIPGMSRRYHLTISTY